MIHEDELLKKIRDGDSASLDKLVAFFETYHEVYAVYGATEDIPKDVYYQKIVPVNAILNRVREVYVDESTGIPVPLYEVSPEEAANFYEQRTERLAFFPCNGMLYTLSFNKIQKPDYCVGACSRWLLAAYDSILCWKRR